MAPRQSFRDALNFELARLQDISQQNEYHNQFVNNSHIPFYSRSKNRTAKNKKSLIWNSVLKFFRRNK